MIIDQTLFRLNTYPLTSQKILIKNNEACASKDIPLQTSILYVMSLQFKQQEPIQFKYPMQEEKNYKPEDNLLKLKIFDYVAELVSNEISIHLYILFLVIDNLQYLAYYNNGLLTYNSLPFAIFAMFADYINLLNFLRKYNINQILVPFFFFFNAVLVLLLIVGYRSHQRKMEKLNKTVSERNYHKNKVQYFVNLIIMIQTTILTIPMFQCSLTAFYCSSGNPFTLTQNCYVGSHILIAAMGFVNLVWILFINFFVAVYYYNRNPFSTTFSTCSSNWYNLGRFIVKITPMLFIMYDPTISYPILFMIVMNVTYPVYLLVFSKFLFGFYRYNFKLQKMVVGIQTFTCFLNTGFIFVQLFQNVKSKQNTILLFWMGAAFVVSLTVAELTGTLKRRLLKYIRSTQKKDLAQILQYMVYLIYQTQQNEEIKKEGFFVANLARTHQLKCEDAACYCVKFMEQRKKPGYNKDKAVFYTLLLAIIDKIIKANTKAYPFFILKAYILYYKLESQIKAATTISIIMSDKLDFSDEMLVKGLLFELNQQYNDTRDMEIYRKFNEFILKQQEETLLIVDLYLSYWEQLIDQNSSIPKMRYLLDQIKKEKAKMQTIVDGALGIFNNHVRVLFLHKTFLKEVINDIPGYLRYQQRYKIGLSQSKLSNVDTVNKIQFRPNQNLLVINFTRNYDLHSDVLGSYKIISISSNIREFLGYSNTELKDSSINKLIPRIYHKYHDSFIDTVLQKRDAEIISYQFRIYPINSSGNIIECNLISKFMPNITHGINIVSFVEQCDVEQDQYVLIYDSKTGVVDSMSKQAENLLKDSSRRRNNDVYASANDFIGDLLPQWDYKNQVWKQLSKNKKAIKSDRMLGEEKIDVKQIEIVRSDGLKQKDIKILKFKGSFFSKMLSLSNESDRLQREMYVFNPNNMLSDPNSGQISQIIQPQSRALIDRDQQPKRQTNEIFNTFKGQLLPIQLLPSKFSRVVFIAIQCFILCLAVGLTTFQFINTNMTFTKYAEDSQLIYNLNTLQSYQSNLTYIISLISANKAYTNSIMTLPYKSYFTLISAEKKLASIDQMLNQITQSVALVNPILISKIGNQEITEDQLMVDAQYLKIRGTKQYFTKSMTIVQTIYQYVSYVREMIKDMRDSKLNIADVLPSPYYFFILANSLDIIPDTMIEIKESILGSISTQVAGGFKTFLVVKLVITALIICSLVTLIVYYAYIYNNFILKVISMYQQIPLQSIKIYEQKCRKYKYYLKQKMSKETQQQTQRSTGSVMNFNSSINLDQKESIRINEEDQNNLLLKVQNNLEQPQVEQLISFESKPQLKSIVCTKIVWIIIYGIVLFILCYSYSNATQSLNQGIIALNNYTLAQNTMIQIRFYTHLSLNLLNYFQPNSLQTIHRQLQQNFELLMELLNTTSLNFTTYKPSITAKYSQLKLVQYSININDTAKINQIMQTIEATLQEMDSMLNYLLGRCTNYLNVMKDEAQTIATQLNIYISFSLLYILVYWLVGVRHYYGRLLDEHQIAYQMHTIIGLLVEKK